MTETIKMLKKIAKALLFPHAAVMIVLLPISIAFLVCSMVFIGTESVIAYISYFVAAYTLTVWCIKIPKLIAYIKRFKKENKYVKRWLDDINLRMNVSLYGSFLWNTAYAVFQLILGFYHSSFWFYSMAAYYIFLAFMRFFLVRYTRKYKPREKIYTELVKYRICGWVFLFMNLALSLMIFFMVYFNRSFNHHEITTIAMAAYTFTAFTVSVINIVKYGKYNSPVFSAKGAISLAAACVSVLTLESTMLTTFGEKTTDLFTRRLFLGISGGAISVFIIAMALYMIVQSTKKIRILKNQTDFTKGDI